MKKIFLLLAVSALVGCAPPRFPVRVESNPSGARVFFGLSANEGKAQGAMGFIGTTPFTWSLEGNGDGTFKNQGGIFLYSDFVPSVAVFEARMDGSTNTLRNVFHCHTQFIRGDKIPEGLFFDFTVTNR